MEAEIKNTVPEDAAELCGPEAVIAYLEGSLEPEAALAFESHLELCPGCRECVNREKVFSGLLDTSLVNDTEVPLPEDFAKRVAVTAESTVVGTADRSNALRAAVIVLGLLFMAAAAAGGNGLSIASVALEKLGAVALAAIHLFYSIGVSVAVLVRSATAPVVDGPLVLPMIFVLVSLVMFVLLRSRHGRTDNTAN